MSAPPNALCFGPDLPATGVACRVSVSSRGLALDLPGAPLHAIPFDGLAIEAGGFDHDHLVVKWTTDGPARTLYIKDPAVIAALRGAAPPEVTARLEHTAAQVRRARTRRRTVLIVSLAAVLGAVLGLWLSFDAWVRLAVARVPVEWERPIGEAAQQEFLAGQTVIREGPSVAAVREILHRLTEAIPDNPYTFQVTIVRSETVNAFALPGGYVVVFTGLLKRAESPEEVAGVLSHELSHVLFRHGLERIVKTLGLVAVVTILTGDQAGLVGLAKRLGVELLTLKFGREQEAEADVEGLRLLHRARIPPDGLIRFFERLSEHDRLQVELLSTHPMSAARAERLKAEAATLPRQAARPFAMDWDAARAGL
ncbi:M48 family metallopeptidase [Nitrospira sp. Kam-Ns4a]